MRLLQFSKDQDVTLKTWLWCNRYTKKSRCFLLTFIFPCFNQQKISKHPPGVPGTLNISRDFEGVFQIFQWLFFEEARWTSWKPTSTSSTEFQGQGASFFRKKNRRFLYYIWRMTYVSVSKYDDLDYCPIVSWNSMKPAWHESLLLFVAWKTSMRSSRQRWGRLHPFHTLQIRCWDRTLLFWLGKLH